MISTLFPTKQEQLKWTQPSIGWKTNDLLWGSMFANWRVYGFSGVCRGHLLLRHTPTWVIPSNHYSIYGKPLSPVFSWMAYADTKWPGSSGTKRAFVSTYDPPERVVAPLVSTELAKNSRRDMCLCGQLTLFNQGRSKSSSSVRVGSKGRGPGPRVPSSCTIANIGRGSVLLESEIGNDDANKCINGAGYASDTFSGSSSWASSSDPSSAPSMNLVFRSLSVSFLLARNSSLTIFLSRANSATMMITLPRISAELRYV